MMNHDEYELDIARMESELYEIKDAYFKARSHLFAKEKVKDLENMFNAAFARGWESARELYRNT